MQDLKNPKTKRVRHQKIIAGLSLLILLTPFFVKALTLEITYPKVPNVLAPDEILKAYEQGSISKNAILPLLFKYIYSLAIYLTGISLFLGLFFASLYYFLLRPQDPVALVRLKKKIKDLLFSAIFLLLSALVINILNPFSFLGIPELPEVEIPTYPMANLSDESEYVIIPLGTLIEFSVAKTASLNAMGHEIWKVASSLKECEADYDKCPPWDWRYWKSFVSSLPYKSRFSKRVKSLTSFSFGTVNSSRSLNLLQAYLNTDMKVSSGERWYKCEEQITKLDPATGTPEEGWFKICKGGDIKKYEKFLFDKEYIYLAEDTTWATGLNQDIMCEGDGPAMAKRFREAGVNCSNYRDATLGAKWAPRELEDGFEISSNSSVVGFRRDSSSQCCNTPYNGDIPINMQGRYLGCVYFKDTRVLSRETWVLTERTTGESFYFNEKKGWIAWIPSKGEGSVPTQEIDPVPPEGPPPGCIEIEKGVSSYLPESISWDDADINYEKEDNPPQSCLRFDIEPELYDPNTNKFTYRIKVRSGSSGDGVGIDTLLIGAPPVHPDNLPPEKQFSFFQEARTLPSLPHKANRTKMFVIESTWLPEVYVRPGQKAKLYLGAISTNTGTNCTGEGKKITLEFTIVFEAYTGGGFSISYYSGVNDEFLEPDIGEVNYDSINAPPAFLFPSINQITRCQEALYGFCSCSVDVGQESDLKGECSANGNSCTGGCSGDPCVRVINIENVAECGYFNTATVPKESISTIFPETLISPSNQEVQPKYISLKPAIEANDFMLSMQIQKLETMKGAFDNQISLTQGNKLRLDLAEALMLSAWPKPIPEPVFYLVFQEKVSTGKMKIRKLNPWYGFQRKADALNFYVPVLGNELMITAIDSQGLALSQITPEDLKNASCPINYRPVPLDNVHKSVIKQVYDALGGKIPQAVLAAIWRIETGLNYGGGICTRGDPRYGDDPGDIICFPGTGGYPEDFCNPSFCGSVSRALNGCDANNIPTNFDMVFSKISVSGGGTSPQEYYNRVKELTPALESLGFEPIRVSKAGTVPQTGTKMCGGAMGPMQIMSGNWLMQESTIRALRNKSKVSPFNLLDAMTYTGLHVKPYISAEPQKCLNIRKAGASYFGTAWYGACVEELYDYYRTQVDPQEPSCY